MMDTAFGDAFFVLILFFAGRSTFGEPTITCGTAGIVYEGDPVCRDPASLTCDFTEDLGKTKQDFYVYRYQHNSETVIVTLCEHKFGEWQCDTTDGYSVATATISHEVTIKISSAELEHSGNYICKTLPAQESSPASACSLVVKEKTAITCDTATTITKGESSLLTCSFTSDVNREKQDFYVYRFHNDIRKPAIIALCSWKGNDAPDCAVDSTYNLLSASISKTVTLEIPASTEEHSGEYVCKTLPAVHSPPARSCSLTVQNVTQAEAPNTSARSYLPVLITIIPGVILAHGVLILIL